MPLVVLGRVLGQTQDWVLSSVVLHAAQQGSHSSHLGCTPPLLL